MATVYVCDICHEEIGPVNEPIERVDVTVTTHNAESAGPGGGYTSTNTNYHPNCFEEAVEGSLKKEAPANR